MHIIGYMSLFEVYVLGLNEQVDVFVKVDDGICWIYDHTLYASSMVFGSVCKAATGSKRSLVGRALVAVGRLRYGGCIAGGKYPGINTAQSELILNS